jgi:hypothetical protein
VVIPAEAATVTEAAARVLTGESLYTICKDLNSRHVPTVRKGLWRPTTLRRILTNPTSAGTQLFADGQLSPSLGGSCAQASPPSKPASSSGNSPTPSSKQS